MEQQKDYIAIDVNETLYFEYGQEIAEMLSISLDPDISLEMFETDVQIRGLILLSGAYKRASEQEPSTKNHHEKEFTAYIEKIMDVDEVEAHFSHRFPIDIRIPKERIDNMEDVRVKIDAFDYELPDEQTLKIKANVHIHGLRTEAVEHIAQSTNGEQRAEKEEYTSVASAEAQDKVNSPNPSSLEEKTSTKNEEQHKNAVTETDEIDLEEHVNDHEESDANVQKQQKELQTNEIDILLSETEEEVDEEETVKDVQFLTELFGEVEEETQTTLTIYITQEEDTIETIAKRFEISALQLIKDNGLSGENLTEGQLLHILRN